MSIFPPSPALGLVALFAGTPVPPASPADAANAELVSLQATATVGGKRYSFTGKGECRHTTEASIYATPAAMWHASFRGSAGGLESASLTLWQPKAGGPIQLNVSMMAAGTSYEVATVKGGTLRGTGNGRVERKGPSGTLIADGRTAGGQTIQVSVACSRFTAPEDNG